MFRETDQMFSKLIIDECPRKLLRALDLRKLVKWQICRPKRKRILKQFIFVFSLHLLSTLDKNHLLLNLDKFIDF